MTPSALDGLEAITAVAGNFLGRFVPARLILARRVPRESREDRHRRLWRTAMFEFAELVDGGYYSQARRRAKRGMRMWPDHPHSHAAMGLVLQKTGHHELALRFLDRAWALAASEREDPWHVRGLHEFEAGDLAVIAAASCTALAAEALNDQERDDRTEQLVEWFSIAIQSDPVHAEAILRNPELPRPLAQRLRGQVGDLSWAVRT